MTGTIDIVSQSEGVPCVVRNKHVPDDIAMCCEGFCKLWYHAKVYTYADINYIAELFCKKCDVKSKLMFQKHKFQL